ncbi:TPR domain protein [Geminocystis sp. NIES-3708]|uniref:tetratricopeptide repeat protein n=1 Tax=Geminocystis sp. NIES-3708 TaxID=1615909 RepID=UPI0005FC772F|nr:tetratricopeptide repeat protein [Geminocystis sp. NIES-3708]BAQ62410.1 TPR domain protein [Geminocystis sp. NIES-3708]
MIRKLQKWLKLQSDTIEAHNPLESESDNHHSPTEISLSHNSEKSLKDRDLEFLFHQLLEGVVNGWQENRIEQFFQKLQPKITVEIWLDWLQRYRNKLVVSPAPHNHFAARMIILGEKTASLPFLRAVGDLAYEIGKELLNRAENNSLAESLRHNLNNDSQDSNVIENQENSEPISLGDVLHLLQNDPDFAEDTARQLGIDTKDPGIIMEKIVQESELITPITPITPIDSVSSDTVNDLFNLGLEKASTGDLEGAIAYWDQALSINNNFSQAWHNRGSALAYLQHFEEAIKSFDRAIALDVNYHQSWNDRGNALYSLHRWQEAVTSWDRTLGLEPNDYQAWYHRGLALEKLNLFSEAISSFQKCLSIYNNYTPAQNAVNRVLKVIKGKGQ